MLPPAPGGGDEGVFNVLLTGFGPFNNHKPWNPSWLAVKPLHNVVMPLDDEPVVIDGQVVMRAPTTTSKHRLVKISALEVPYDYLSVLDVVPNLHLRPPVLPDEVKDNFYRLPPDKGYDFIFHVGVAGRGPLRVEKLGHKTGYFMKDASGKMAPIIKSPPSDFGRREELDVSVGEQPIERIGLGFELESAGDTYSARPNRGFGVGYEKFPDELYTDIDVSRLVYDLRNSGVEQIYSSMDAGHYLCDFMYYCSLAESKRNGKTVAEPLTTEEVTEAIRRIIYWVCTELAEIHDLASST
ncbi:peptidase C15, pyroglutamyl peptidase I-like protein [Gymnopus androsaceus JB14]|uniref:Peptidase C15, pyroglutamyl peptidase I-like protein n=1 Tax=Gymnopus androsaceus JB14 TaxID=1447944 RepID=A0A6A4HUL4_9AGAR|nr:peptidase C15, pyroglutamyl peptidase I-like protein [Gymnopus androsaceus JB14]